MVFLCLLSGRVCKPSLMNQDSILVTSVSFKLDQIIYWVTVICRMYKKRDLMKQSQIWASHFSYPHLSSPYSIGSWVSIFLDTLFLLLDCILQKLLENNIS